MVHANAALLLTEELDEEYRGKLRIIRTVLEQGMFLRVVHDAMRAAFDRHADRSITHITPET